MDLNSTENAIVDKLTRLSLGISLHVGYEDQALAKELMDVSELIMARWKRRGHAALLFVSVVHESMQAWMSSTWPFHTIRLIPNVGICLLGFLEGSQWYYAYYPEITHMLKLHTKANLLWRNQLLQPLIRTEQETEIIALGDPTTSSVI